MFKQTQCSLISTQVSNESQTKRESRIQKGNLKQIRLCHVYVIKGDGNDGEPDAHRKLEFEGKAKNWLELKNYGWFGMIFENIKFDLPKEVRGQS